LDIEDKDLVKVKGGKTIEEEQNISDCLMEARFEFRQLLEEYGLVLLAGSEADAIAWLETQIIKLADSVSRRKRFIGLLRQTREVLSRGQEKSKVLLNAERKERLNPYVEARFRRFRI
jgi:hypothetical protein